jgi:hypothetical protein
VSELDRYLTELDRHLSLGRRRRARVLEEVRDHLAEGEGDGADLAAAIERFGAPAVVARAFNAGHSTRLLRRAPVLGVLVGSSIFVAMALSASGSATPWRAPTAEIVLFSSAVVCAQIALAAGLILCGRIVGTIGERTISSRESVLARRSAIALYVGEFAAAALLVSMLVIDAAMRRSAPGTLIAGAALIGLAGLAGAVGAWRMRSFTPTSDGPLDEERLGAPARLAWLVFDVIGRHPVVSCAVVAGLAAIGSANHAETSLVGSLPWAFGQAAVVVVVFVAMRGWLGLVAEPAPVAAD